MTPPYLPYANCLRKIFSCASLFLLILNTKGLAQPKIITFEIKNGKFAIVQRDSSTHPNNDIKPPFKPIFTPITANKNSPPPAPLTISVSTVQPSCGYYNGSIYGVASGGTPPYLYSLDPGFYYNTGYFNRGAGNYNITVTDATGATATAPAVLVNNPTRPRVRIQSFVRTSGCSFADGSITLVADQGLPPYEFSLDRVNWQTSPTFNNLTSGGVTIYVRDANGCIQTEDFLGSFTALDLKPLNCHDNDVQLIMVQYTNNVCANEGSFVVTTKIGGPYTFSLDGINYQTNPVFNNLGPGLYNFYYKDPVGQVRVFSISFSKFCSPTIALTPIRAACGQNNGSFTLSVTGDSPPYTYTMDGINYQTSNVFSNLAAGYYNFTIQDRLGVHYYGTVEIPDECPQVSLIATNETCARNDGAITATPTKGTAPFQYSIDGINFQNSNLFNGLTAGNYTITVRDATNHTSTTNITIRTSCLAVTATNTNVICGNMNGTITATASNGTPPYQYSINGINFQGSNIFNGLGAANYTVTVKDFTGLTATTNVTITDAPSPIIRVNTTPTSCANNDGVITITGTGGTPPLTYSINGINYQPGNVFNNIVSGPYNTWVKDANGCAAGTTVSVVVNCPTITPVITPETCGNGNGSIVINITNGNGFGPYTYSLDGINFQTSNAFTNLAANNYIITVKDNQGYSHAINATVISNCPAVTAIITNSTCGAANGTITATGSNGTAPYLFSIDGINFQSNNVFTGLPAANYIVSLKDANGTVRTTNAIINNIGGPQLNIQSTNASCLNNDATVTLTATGGTAPFTYNIDGGAFIPNPVFTGKVSGNHTGIVKDANGCTATGIITVGLNNNLRTDPILPVNICEGKSTQLTLNTNGTGFSWVPASGLNNFSISNPVASPVTTTPYTVPVSLGVCSGSQQVLVNVDKAPVANAGQPSTICYGQNAQLTGSGGQTYTWSPSSFLDNIHSPAPVVARATSTITYSLHVVDDKGCHSLTDAKVTVTVTPPPKLFAGNDTAIIMNQPFQLLALDVNNSGFTNYVWSPPYGLNDYHTKTPIATLDQDIKYRVSAFTPAGCEGSDEINIKVYLGPEIYVPNAFTPGTDGKNDLLKAVPVGIKKFNYFIVYNRWGNQVFYTTDPSKGWDGTMNHITEQTGVFVWMAEGIDDKGNHIRRKGSVTLIR